MGESTSPSDAEPRLAGVAPEASTAVVSPEARTAAASPQAPAAAVSLEARTAAIPLDERLAAVAAALRELASGGELPAEGVRAVLAAATTLYGAAVAQRGREIALADPGVSPTDAVVLCCALLRGQDLNPFDLTLWFGRVVPDAPA